MANDKSTLLAAQPSYWIGKDVSDNVVDHAWPFFHEALGEEPNFATEVKTELETFMRQHGMNAEIKRLDPRRDECKVYIAKQVNAFIKHMTGTDDPLRLTTWRPYKWKEAATKGRDRVPATITDARMKHVLIRMVTYVNKQLNRGGRKRTASASVDPDCESTPAPKRQRKPPGGRERLSHIPEGREPTPSHDISGTPPAIMLPSSQQGASHDRVEALRQPSMAMETPAVHSPVVSQALVNDMISQSIARLQSQVLQALAPPVPPSSLAAYRLIIRHDLLDRTIDVLADRVMTPVQYKDSHAFTGRESNQVLIKTFISLCRTADIPLYDSKENSLYYWDLYDVPRMVSSDKLLQHAFAEQISHNPGEWIMFFVGSAAHINFVYQEKVRADPHLAMPRVL